MVDSDRSERLWARPGAVAYEAEPGPTGIALEISAGLLPRSAPEVRVNGRVVPSVEIGANTVAVPPGNHQVEVTIRPFLGPNFGAAHAEVPVRAGRVTRVYYRMPPPGMLLSGVIGPVPRRVPGAVVMFWFLVAVIVYMVLLLAVGSIL